MSKSSLPTKPSTSSAKRATDASTRRSRQGLREIEALREAA